MLSEDDDTEAIEPEEIIKILSEKIDAIQIPQPVENTPSVDITEQVNEIKEIVSSQKSFLPLLYSVVPAGLSRCLQTKAVLIWFALRLLCAGWYRFF